MSMKSLAIGKVHVCPGSTRAPGMHYSDSLIPRLPNLFSVLGGCMKLEPCHVTTFTYSGGVGKGHQSKRYYLLLLLPLLILKLNDLNVMLELEVN